MGGRLALVIGSECAALATLDFPGPLAGELHSRLSELGGWQDATSQAGPILNPTAGELTAALDEALATASPQRRDSKQPVLFEAHALAYTREHEPDRAHRLRRPGRRRSSASG